MRSRLLAPLLLALLALPELGCDTSEPGGDESDDGKTDGLDSADQPFAIPVFINPGEGFATTIAIDGASTVWLQQVAGVPGVRARLRVNGIAREGVRPILDSDGTQLTVEVEALGTTSLDGAIMVQRFDPARVLRSVCMTCHAVDRKLVGPSLREIAQRYAGDSRAEDLLQQRVELGSTGAWGLLPMPPDRTTTEADRRAMIRYILGLR